MWLTRPDFSMCFCISKWRIPRSTSPCPDRLLLPAMEWWSESKLSARLQYWEVGSGPIRASRFPARAEVHVDVHALLLCGRSTLPLTKSDCGGIRAEREPGGSRL